MDIDTRFIDNDYFEWLYFIVCKNKPFFRKLLSHLHSTTFRWSIENDHNRAMDGRDLRDRFAKEIYGQEELSLYLDHPCTVLEMMVALALRCEETIMDDPSYGNRTAQWFWEMLVSLGIYNMTDDSYSYSYVESAISKFINREYSPNGKGGLFTVKDTDANLRELEIWSQLALYLGKII